MKKLYIAILSIFLLSSCGDSFLESNPTTEIPEDQYYTTEARILSGLMAAYGPLQWPDWAFGQYNPLEFVSDIMSDDVRVGGSNANDNEHLQRMRFFNATPNYVCEGLWKVFYSGINRANIVINRMDNVKNISEASKNRILAEAHVLRAYYYSWLWKLWGNLPYYTVNPASAPYLVEQIKADDVYTNIIKDLDYALSDNKLPSSVSMDQLGRFTRAAAQMLKANVVMYQNDQTKYGECLVDMKEVIGSGQYKLIDNFGQIWEDTGEWSSESIFEVNYSDENSVRGWNNALGVGGSVYPTLIGINNLKDKTFAGGWGFEPVEETLYDLYESTDQRKDGGILSFAKLKASNPSASYDPRYDNTGFFNKKYLPRIGGNAKCPGDKDLNYRNNYRLYRFAETLLIAAELTIRTGGSQTDADSYLNQVRARAYKMDVTDTAFDGKKKTATLDNLLLENRLEFACEGHRFWDLVRFGKAQQVLGSRGYSENKKHLPIPQSEIDKAQGTLTQNPY